MEEYLLNTIEFDERDRWKFILVHGFIRTYSCTIDLRVKAYYTMIRDIDEDNFKKVQRYTIVDYLCRVVPPLTFTTITKNKQ